MEQFNLEKLDKQKSIHMIGIGGISMSALAVILKTDGFSVTGSDFKDSSSVQNLIRQGIAVSVGHSPENIKDPAAVVYTAAISRDNPELMYAKTLGVPVVERAVLLGAIMKRYETPIAVSGTHGKTTTTSMLSQVLMAEGLDPTILVGGILPSIGSNMHIGKNEYLVTEACEYCGSFLKFFPKISLILNVEEDHLDYFKDINDIIDCFHTFAEITPEDGALIVNGDDKNALASVAGINRPVITFSTEDKMADFFADSIAFNGNGCGEFTVLKNGEFYMEAALSVPGPHNVKNALAVIAAADLLGVTPESIQKGFDAFGGTKRRFEQKGLYNGARVIDDYAHHPTEIMTTLKTAKTAGSGKVWCVFQPHTYTRAFKLKEEFSRSFKDADGVLVVDIYAAREKDTGLISSRELAEEIQKHSHNAQYIKSFEEAEAILKSKANPGDFVITLGAGDVNKIAEDLVAEKNQ
ncbi:MAG: UDP-N-acetylmuramate--L-alanine ligase [Clostridia bacterium]|nr:UDP-N-acetylmuramate--L-alanine ligase [Clostridia bacterium]